MSSLLRRPFGTHGKVHEITPAIVPSTSTPA